jgi:CBS domain-containing protein
MQKTGKRVVDVVHRGTVVCEGSASVATAARMMAAHRIHSVAVTGPAGVIGVVTDAEIADALYAGALDSRRVEEIARPAALVRLPDTLAYALERMHECNTTHAVAVDRSFRPLGIVSVLDLVEAMLEQGAS